MLQITGMDPRQANRDPEKAIALWNNYLEYLNCLHSTMDWIIASNDKPYFVLFEITSRDAFLTKYINGEWAAEDIATFSLNQVFQMRRWLGHYQDSSLSGHAMAFAYPVFEKATFDTVAKAFGVIVSNKRLLRSMNYLAKSISEFKLGSYAISLMLAWFVIEQKIDEKWEGLIGGKDRQLSEGRKRFSSKRRESLTGRDYTMSVISNILEIADGIDYELFERIDRVRGWRNKIVHQDADFTCSQSNCKAAIELAFDLALENAGVSVKPNLTISAPDLNL